ncbi:MAG: spore germination protein [Tepidanaerobacteraceae bacterium]|nr:spore germination protein [Tepidanaerobacteraceae bacterium]
MWLLITTSNSLLIPLSQTAIAAGSRQDSWLAEILSLAIQLVMLQMILKFSLLSKDMEFSSRIKKICGRIVGSIVIVLYIWFFVFSSAAFLKELTSFAVAMIYVQTPSVVIDLMIILTSCYMAFHGLEVQARTNEIILPTIISLYLIGLFLLLPNVKLDNFKPVLENGLTPVIKGAFISSSSFVFTVFVPVVLSYVNKPEECQKTLTIGSIIQGFLLIIATAIITGVLGPNLAQVTIYRGYIALRYISYGNFVEHLDPIGFSIFVLSKVVQISLFIYAASLISAQFLAIKSYKPLIFPTGFIILLLSNIFKNVSQLNRFFITLWPLHNFFFEMVIPLFLWILILFGGRERNLE